MIDLQIYFQKITLWIKKKIISLEKKLLQFLFGILINATFFQIVLVQELKKDLKLIYITNKRKNEYNGFISK